MIYIETYGRFGNNIQQLLHAIHIAKRDQHAKIYFSFSSIRCMELTLSSEHRCSKDEHGTFFRIDAPPTWEQYKSYATLIYPYIISSPPPFTSEQLHTDLFVHIRGGDIFRENPHRRYIQPPLAYYTSIITKLNKNVHLICEDDTNPVVNSLKELGYPIYFLSLDKTIGTFLKARHIVASFGTFLHGITVFQEPDVIYVPAYEMCQYVSPRATRIEIPKYIDEWHGTPEQRQFMLTYSEPLQIP
jgi:hypothetical protein